MTTYTSIPNASLAVGGIPSSTTVTLLRDNPIAISEASSGAPINVAGWHPYDKVTVGDGKDGVIYDFASTGAQTTITSPDFEDGYEYRFFGKLSSTFVLEMYGATDAAWFTTTQSLSGLLGNWFDFHLDMPRVSRDYHVAFGHYAAASASVAVTILSKGPNVNTFGSNKLLRIRFTGGTSASGNKIWMMRRREYASSP